MVGRGPGARIGEAHRISIRLDIRFELVAGVFSRNADKNIEMGQTFQAHLPVSLNVLNCDSYRLPCNVFNSVCHSFL